MRDKSAELDANFSTESYNSINTYAKNHLNYDYPLEELEALNKKYVEENDSQYHVDDKKKVLEEANLLYHLHKFPVVSGLCKEV